MGCREQPPRGAPWVSGLVRHFVQTWPDSECSHTACTVQLLDSAVLRLKNHNIFFLVHSSSSSSGLTCFGTVDPFGVVDAP